MSVILQLRHGDCVEVLSAMPDSSVGSIVCDPPYDLTAVSRGGSPRINNAETPYGRTRLGSDHKGFMGKTWDATGIAFSDEFWNEVVRVLALGGAVKAFGGTRTFHRMAAAMERAGFEDLRLEAWCYGSGFPKSMNISKVLDKQAGRLHTSIVVLKKELCALFNASGKSRKVIDDECGFRACNYLSYPELGKQPDPWFNVLPSQAKWQVLKRVLGVVDASMETQLDEFFAEAEREVLGFRKVIPGVAFSVDGPRELPITAPATDAARQWDGWGTALKPAWEPVIVARKPLS